MRAFYILLVAISFFSCQEKEFEAKITHAYELTSIDEKDTVIVDDINIIDVKKVDKNFFNELKINKIKYLINLERTVLENTRNVEDQLEKSIESRQLLAELDEINKETYLNLIIEDEKKLSKAQTEIALVEDKLAKDLQSIVLLEAELGVEAPSDYNLIEFVFDGSINFEKRVDTLKIIINAMDEYSFVKNNQLSSY